MTLMTSSATDSPQIDSSATWPRFDVVSTEYQEQASAIAMRGTTARATAIPSALRAVREISLSINAHCPTKHSSATVATDRPTMTLDSQWLNRQMRGTSYTGKADRNAQPNTYTADRRSCRRRVLKSSAGMAG